MSEIIRVQRRRSFTVLDNRMIDEGGLSWEALGMMTYLLRKPDNWQVRLTDLVNYTKAGISKVRRIIKELDDAGYIKRRRICKPDGGFDWESTVYEFPEIASIDTNCTDSKSGDLTSPDSTKDVSPGSESSSTMIQSGGAAPVAEIVTPPVEKPALVLESPPVKKRRRRTPRTTDPRSSHRAIQAVKHLTKHYPKKSLYEKVIAVLGETPDKELLKQCWDAWDIRDYKPTSLVWLFEWYVAGGPPGKRKVIDPAFPRDEWVPVLAEVCRLDERISRNHDKLVTEGAELWSAGYTIEEVNRLYARDGWWYRDDWRGKKGQPPTPEDVQRTIKQAKKSMAVGSVFDGVTFMPTA